MSNTSLGIPENIANFLAYLFGWISGLIVLLVEKSNGDVRFHAAQSFVFFGICSLAGVLSVVPVLGPIVAWLVGVLAVVVWVVQIVLSLMGKPLKLPVVSNIANLLLLKMKAA